MQANSRNTRAPRASRTRDQGCPTTGKPSRPKSRSRAPFRTADLPLAIWPCAQTTGQWQRHGRYLRESSRHPGKMLPALARRAVETFSDPGALVLDPMCGIGTTLVEASQLGRRAIGIELEPRWADLARANLAQHPSRNRKARVLGGDARRAPQLLKRHARGALADLILTSPPYGCALADVSENKTKGSGSLRRADTENYSPDRSNLGHARGRKYLEAMRDVYAASAAALKPGGYLVLVTKDMRANGGLQDLSGDTIQLCQENGLQYWQRIIGLLATVRDDEIVMRPSLWQILVTRRARDRGELWHVVAHEDVLVFRKPGLAPAVTRRARA
jgi:modification methylase